MRRVVVLLIRLTLQYNLTIILAFSKLLGIFGPHLGLEKQKAQTIAIVWAFL